MNSSSHCKRLFLIWAITLTTTLFITVLGNSFDDSVLFQFNWAGSDSERLNLPKDGDETMIITTHNNEKYQCSLPNLDEKLKGDDEPYHGLNPLHFLEPLFSQSSCSYRLESYWTYEVCHGRYVRQYHEEREGKKVKLQEYFLGRWDSTQHEKLYQELKADAAAGYPNPLPVKKLDGLTLPYLQMNLSDGTICDLNGKPRKTNILYVCYNHGKHEIYSFKETSTCEYELIVLSALLCKHPKYRPLESGEFAINCLPMEGSLRKPRNLLALETHSLKLKNQRMLEKEALKKLFAVVYAADKGVQEEEGPVKFEFRVDDGEEFPAAPVARVVKAEPFPAEDTKDKTALQSFLFGESCLHGGSGWWKYEFCYGKHVEQYHVEKDGSRTVVRLGTFDRQGHIDWLEKNLHKRPKPLATRTYVSLFYGGGSICDKTGKPRETEVKMRCVTDQSASSVSLYLLEPHTCQYILGVDSPIICQLLPLHDEHGLIPVDAQITPPEPTVVESEKPKEEL